MTATPARQALLSAIDVAAQGVALAALYAFLLRALGAAEVGLWSIIFSITIAGRAVDLGLSRGLIRYIPLEGHYPGRSNRLLNAAVAGTFILTVPVVMISGLALYLVAPLLLETRTEQVWRLAPLAIAVVTLTMFGQVYLNALTAVYRSDFRALVGISSTVSLLTATILFVPLHGLRGLLWAQLLQQLGTIVIACALLRRCFPGFRVFPAPFGRAELRLLIGYGWKLHVAGLAMLLFEPASRMIMGALGSLEAVAYFDMASRLLQQFRNVIVTANQVITPYFARLTSAPAADLNRLYNEVMRTTGLFALPLLAAVVGSAHLISVLWIGEPSSLFVTFVVLIGVGWGVNVIGAPAYFLANASGHLNVIVVSHVIVALGSSVVALALGFVWGEIGVATGVMAGLVAGTLYCMDRVHTVVLGRRDFVVGLDVAYGAACLSAAAVGLFAWPFARDVGSPLLAGAFASAACVAPVAAALAWRLRRGDYKALIRPIGASEELR